MSNFFDSFTVDGTVDRNLTDHTSDSGDDWKLFPQWGIPGDFRIRASQDKVTKLNTTPGLTVVYNTFTAATKKFRIELDIEIDESNSGSIWGWGFGLDPSKITDYEFVEGRYSTATGSWEIPQFHNGTEIEYESSIEAPWAGTRHIIMDVTDGLPGSIRLRDDTVIDFSAPLSDLIDPRLNIFIVGSFDTGNEFSGWTQDNYSVIRLAADLSITNIDVLATNIVSTVNTDLSQGILYVMAKLAAEIPPTADEIINGIGAKGSGTVEVNGPVYGNNEMPIITGFNAGDYILYTTQDDGTEDNNKSIVQSFPFTITEDPQFPDERVIAINADNRVIAVNGS